MKLARWSVLLVLVVCFTALAACKGRSSQMVPTDQAADLLVNRNWMDHWPNSRDEQLHVYRFTPSMGGGVFQDRTLYKGTFELFRFETSGDEIRFDLPETRTKVVSKFHIETVRGPKPFDLKLTIDADPRGPQVYYGMRSETDRSGQLLEQRLATTPQ